MDPAHYEKELNELFEFLMGYIKRLKAKNLEDDEREKVSTNVMLPPYKYFPFFVLFVRYLGWGLTCFTKSQNSF